MNRLIELYPRAWRDRYELEFLGVMEARKPSLGDRVDVVRGAVDARLHPQVAATGPEDPAPSRSARLGGFLAVVGGLLWAFAGIAFNSTLINPALGYKEVDAAGAIAIAAALVTALASLTLARSMPERPAVMSNTALAILFSGLTMLLPWPMVALGFMATCLATSLFALMAASRVGVTGLLLALAAVFALLFNTEDQRALLLVPLGVVWILFGAVVAVRPAPATGDSRPT